MSEIIGGLAKFAGVWYFAGLISSGISMLFIYLFSSWIGVTTELLINSVIGTLTFPFSLLVSYAIDPFSFVAGLIFQVLVFLGILYLKK
jgi:hypothetical protein